TNRGGKGVKTISVTDKTGSLIAIKNVTDEDDLMIITKKGVIIRSHINQIRVMGRAAQGVRVINLSKGGEIAAVAKVPKEENEESMDQDGENGTDNDSTSSEE